MMFYPVLSDDMGAPWASLPQGIVITGNTAPCRRITNGSKVGVLAGDE